MQIGMVGLGRMGANMVRRLHAGGHECVVYDVMRRADRGARGRGRRRGARTLDDLVAALDPPRHVWLMVPAAFVGDTVVLLAPLLTPGDTIIDGGNSLVPPRRRPQRPLLRRPASTTSTSARAAASTASSAATA